MRLPHDLHASAREEADQLVAAGRHHEAIDVLTAANRHEPDADIEAHLVRLRRDAPVRDVAPSRRRRRWSRLTDGLPRAPGIPEIPRARLSGRTLRTAIARHGCLLVRGLVDPPRVQQLVDDIDHTFAAYDAAANGTPTAETSPWFVPFDPPSGHELPREWIRAGGGVAAVDSPRALFDAIETFDEVGLRKVVTDYLGEPPLMLAKKWTLRRLEPEGSPGDWHQDGAFLGPYIRSIDVWLSLSHCGVNAPGLDVVARRFADLVEVGTNGAIFEWSVGDRTVQELAADEVVRPVFEPGDALILDHLCLHRTAITAAMTERRYAIEAWLAAPSSYPESSIPIAY